MWKFVPVGGPRRPRDNRNDPPSSVAPSKLEESPRGLVRSRDTSCPNSRRGDPRGGCYNLGAVRTDYSFVVPLRDQAPEKDSSKTSGPCGSPSRVWRHGRERILPPPERVLAGLGSATSSNPTVLPRLRLRAACVENRGSLARPAVAAPLAAHGRTMKICCSGRVSHRTVELKSVAPRRPHGGGAEGRETGDDIGGDPGRSLTACHREWPPRLSPSVGVGGGGCGWWVELGAHGTRRSPSCGVRGSRIDMENDVFGVASGQCPSSDHLSVNENFAVPGDYSSWILWSSTDTIR